MSMRLFALGEPITELSSEEVTAHVSTGDCGNYRFRSGRLVRKRSCCFWSWRASATFEEGVASAS